MKNSFFLIIILGIFVSSNSFSQNNVRNDPFQGVWFTEFGGENAVFFFVDGILVLFNYGTEMYNYTISGNRLQFNNVSGDREFNFTIVNENNVTLRTDGVLMQLIRQNNPSYQTIVSFIGREIRF